MKHSNKIILIIIIAISLFALSASTVHAQDSDDEDEVATTDAIALEPSLDENDAYDPVKWESALAQLLVLGALVFAPMKAPVKPLIKKYVPENIQDEAIWVSAFLVGFALAFVNEWNVLANFDAFANTHEIMAYLATGAGAAIASLYGHHLKVVLDLLKWWNSRNTGEKPE